MLAKSCASMFAALCAGSLHAVVAACFGSLLHLRLLLVATCCKSFGMKYFCALTIPENFFECWLQIATCNSKRGLESHMGHWAHRLENWRRPPLEKSAWKF